MERIPVSSSMIRSIGYDAESQILEIEFCKGGVYQYSEVPQAEYDSLMATDSHGKYFLGNIKERYATAKM